MTVCSDVQRIRQELNLLQKLYSLYNDVLDKVNGYYDIPWVDVDIDKINNDLLEFQNRSVTSRNFRGQLVQARACTA